MSRRQPRGGRAGKPRDGSGSAARFPGPSEDRAAADASPMIVYGRNPVREAVRGPRRVIRIWATAPAARSEDWLAALEPDIASDQEIADRAGTSDHQGVAAEVDAYRYADPRHLLDEP